ncbi:phosphatase PAP2 family protein [Chondromyces crocatus]|uniref:Phosphatidic acid phosphatase n=1 Tax=Chondromyces crocatus TaxID=52 RepID=A0A0K1EHQ8_CHOCO|nr:phosphatase PAP2 family protein [Chondromyces crocatus]AKT40394.1 phosphatidic acid phosphatase [Chondromyces crocatus]
MIQHARSLWGALWWLPPLPWLGYTLALTAAGLVRWDHLVITALVVAAAYASHSTRRFFLHALPLLLLVLVFDSMRYWIHLGVDGSSILTCSLRDLERTLFGVRVHGERLTPNQLLARLQTPLLDVLCAVPYGLYLFVLCGHFLYLYFADCNAARRLAWIAFGTHLLGFVTYRLLPAAPPWYVDAHGCAADLAATNSPAGLTRVDALLGVAYFRDLYSRGATVFGALPSLHAAYPLMGLFATYHRASLPSRALQIAYAALMAFAAIYLDHHWLLDVLLGVLYVALTAFVVTHLLRETETTHVGCNTSPDARPAHELARASSP